ncbi:MAG: D-alanyl-D-alanine carboxypeptidase family protein [Candidatus Binataceae bacterium]
MGCLRGPAGQYSHALARLALTRIVEHGLRRIAQSPTGNSRHTITALLTIAAVAVFPLAARATVRESIVVDAQSGHVLESDNATAIAYPASLTKLMTLYLVFGALHKGALTLNQPLPVSAHAAGQPATRLGLHPGEKITVEQAILAIVTKSANDAAVVLSEALGGSEAHFALMMTDKARQLGMPQTVFRNASGLPDVQQHTTARDMATLARALIQDYPGYYHFFSARSFIFHGHIVEGHDHLLGEYPGTDGLKTGYTHVSGYNLVTSAVHHGRRLIGVVIGGATFRARDVHMMALLNTGFAHELAHAELAGAGLRRDSTEPSLAISPHISATPIVTNPMVQATAEKEADAIAAPARALANRNGGGLIATVVKSDMEDSDAAVTRAAAQPAHELAAPAGSHRWRSEIGGHYRRSRTARRVRANIVHNFSRQLHGLRPDIIHHRRGRSRFYRLAVVDLTHAAAHRLCRAFARKRYACKVAGPSGKRGVLEAAR